MRTALALILTVLCLWQGLIWLAQMPPFLLPSPQAVAEALWLNRAEIARHAREIYLQAGISKAMPPGNVTYLTAEDRDLLTAWYESATAGKATE